ncbi:sensor histidine kinase [Halorientalis litorea]|uniref:sensor histidine kinase n=1 Tax=Halorientalis litorea TaxID=2931977 RepID=UPI001FF65067|nr:histidine kinase N-terminal 7TM domain-containing protein [Halorientalis litorea]
MFPGGISPVWLAYLAGPVVTVITGKVLVYWIYNHHWDKRGSKTFAGVLLVGGYWLCCLFVHVAVTDTELQRLAVIAQSIGAFASIAAFSVFASVYAARGFHHRRWFQLALYGSLGTFALLVVTNPLHNLAWRSISHVTEPFSYAIIEPGVGSVAVLAVLVALNGYCWVALVNYLLSTGNGSGTQLLLVLLGAMSIAVAQLVGSSGLAPADGLNHAAYGTVAFVVFSTFGLFRFNLLGRLPVARKAVVESLNDPVFVLDAEHRIVDVNDASRATWPAVDGRNGIPFAQACPTLAERVEMPDGGTATDSDRISVTVDGQTRHYSVNTTTVSRGRADEVQWYVVLLREVTELERSRWQLEKQNDRLDQVASTISHDLRNPINVADGYAQSLELRVKDWDIEATERERATADLTRIQESLGRMEAIIDDVLTIAREGETVEDTDSIPLSVVAREAWNNVDTAEASLTIEADSILDANRNRTLSILENLFRNTLDHGGSTVTVTVGATPDGFFVADDGPGIPVSHRSDVFEYGYTTADEGTGLGLSIVRTMAESHGWTVELDDDYHDGTRFVFGGVRSFPTATA